MLILSRKTGQQIVIGSEELLVTVLEIRGKQVRLGITAPREVPVQRTRSGRPEEATSTETCAESVEPV